MYCIIKCIVQRKQARVKNADLRRPSRTVVMQKRKSASPVLNMLILWSCGSNYAVIMVFDIDSVYVLSLYSTPNRKLNFKDACVCECEAQNIFRAMSEIINDLTQSFKIFGEAGTSI